MMTAIIGWQVFARYVLNDSPAWSESLALLLMLYYILLAAAAGIYEGFHLRLSFLLDKLSPPNRKALEIINFSLIAIFGLCMMIFGWQMAHFTSEHVIPTLGVSRSMAYWPFAAAGFLFCLFALEKILTLIMSKES